MRPQIFISAVSKELGSARSEIQKTLSYLGYEAVWQDAFDTVQGDLRRMLREKIDPCQGVIQLVGECYGTETNQPDPEFGRVSHTQYEALYAKSKGKKVWYFLIDPAYPHRDPHEAEPEAHRNLQKAYRDRIISDSDLYHPVLKEQELENKVLKIQDELKQLRRSFQLWMYGVALGVALVVIGVFSLIILQLLPESTAGESLNQALAAEKWLIEERNPSLDADEIERRALNSLADRHGLSIERLKAQIEEELETLSSGDGEGLDAAVAAYEAGAIIRAKQIARNLTERSEQSKERFNAFMLLGRIAIDEDAYNQAATEFHNALDEVNVADSFTHWAEAKEGTIYADFLSGEASALAQYEILVRRRKNVEGMVPGVLGTMTNYGAVLLSAKEWERAESIFRSVLKKRLETHSPGDSRILGLKLNLATIAQQRGDFEKAIGHYTDIVMRAHSDDDRLRLRARFNLANIQSWKGEWPAAEEAFALLQPEVLEVFGHEDSMSLNLLNARAWNLFLMERLEAGADVSGQALEIMRKRPSQYGMIFLNTLDTHASLLSGKGKVERAINVYGELFESATILGLLDRREVWKSCLAGAALGVEHGHGETVRPWVKSILRFIRPIEAQGPVRILEEHRETLRLLGLLGSVWPETAENPSP